MQEKNWEIITPLEFQCTDNWYLIRGKKYARVTRVNSIIDKPELRFWYSKVGNEKAKEILKTRANFGSTLHKLIQVQLSGGKITEENYDNYLLESMEIFNKWFKKHDIITHELETHLWSETYGFAGTCDFIGSCDGKFVMGDWKSSKSVYPEYWLQLSAYVVAFEELTGLKLDSVFILQIRDGKYDYQEKSRDEILKLFEVFKSAMVIYRWKYGE